MSVVSIFVGLLVGYLLSLSSMSRYSIIAPSGSVAPSSALKAPLAVSQM